MAADMSDAESLTDAERLLQLMTERPHVSEWEATDKGFRSPVSCIASLRRQGHAIAELPTALGLCWFLVTKRLQRVHGKARSEARMRAFEAAKPLMNGTTSALWGWRVGGGGGALRPISAHVISAGHDEKREDKIRLTTVEPTEGRITYGRLILRNHDAGFGIVYSPPVALFVSLDDVTVDLPSAPSDLRQCWPEIRSRIEQQGAKILAELMD